MNVVSGHIRTASLDDLWGSAAATGTRIWRPEQYPTLSEPALRYLTHAIAPGTALASAVRLQMHGEMKLKGWTRFTAQQVIVYGKGMIWRAAVRMFAMPVYGFDRLLNGQGAMQWKLFGIIPVMAASGPDITRSTAGRVLAESVWLPSALSTPDVTWIVGDASHPHARVTADGESTDLTLTTDNRGGLEACALLRWGNPGGGPFRYAPFGAVIEEEP